MEAKYNTADNGNPDTNMSEGSFTEWKTNEEVSSNCELQNELIISAMSFSSLHSDVVGEEKKYENEESLELEKTWERQLRMRVCYTYNSDEN